MSPVMERNSNVFQFQGSKMIVSAKGPHINKKFTINSSFCPNLLSSTMNMPRNFEKQSSTASVTSQRSIYHGRDTSPTASVCSDMQPRNFHQPFYQRGYSQRSVYNREGSPMSMRSIDSTASRADIVIDAIQSLHCTEDEWKKIWHAVNRKHEMRKKKDEKKRRKMKMFLKNLKNKSDSEGEQGSRSSISNDDCASTRTGYSQRYDPYWKENVPRSINSLDCQSEVTFRSNNKDAYRSYARSDSQNPYQAGINAYPPANMLPYQKQTQFGSIYFSHTNGYSGNESTMYSSNNTVCGPKNTFASQRYINGQANMPSIQRTNLNSSICSAKSMQNMTMMSQRDRFRGGFQFPSQKFNRSTVNLQQEQVRNKHFSNNENNIHRDHINEQSDENDHIFKDTTAKPKSGAKKTQKRKVENLDVIPNPAKKKPKITSSNDKLNKLQSKNDNEDNEFEFVKPMFPVRKSAPAKPQEKLISKSYGAPDLLKKTQKKENLEPQSVAAASPEPDVEADQSENTQLTTSDMSMRPSFMKRKLFTQTLDVTEKKNNSFSSSTDSPQSNIYSALSREKHKTRKLATSQSLLSRDINQDDDNLLDLIHKIVPPKQVNSTMTANITKPNSRVSGNRNGDDKWDVTSIISICNNDSVSETYTDDEIFKVGNDDKKAKAQEKLVVRKNKTDDKNTKPSKVNDEPTTQNDKPNEKPKKPTVKPNKPNEKPNKPAEKSDKPNDNPNRPTDKLNKPNEKLNKLIDKPNDKPNAEMRKTNVNNLNPKNNKNRNDVVKKTALPPAPKSDAPVKICPAKVALSRSRIDAFWDTDESDYECAGSRRALQPLHFQDQMRSHISSPKQISTEHQVNTSSLKMTKTNNPQILSPLVVLHNLDEDLHKQPSKKTVNKTRNERKTLKKSNNDTSKADKLGKTEKHTQIITPRTRRQISLSATLVTANNSYLNEKDPSSNDTALTKPVNKKKLNNEKKATQEKKYMTKLPSELAKSRNKKQNDSHHQIKLPKKQEHTPKSQRAVKTTKLQNPTEHLKIDICKVLRSRNVDLSSSFNSDKFELTMSRTRKSRTPSKRISFSKSKNILVNNNKIRGKATKP